MEEEEEKTLKRSPWKSSFCTLLFSFIQEAMVFSFIQEAMSARLQKQMTARDPEELLLVPMEVLFLHPTVSFI